MQAPGHPVHQCTEQYDLFMLDAMIESRQFSCNHDAINLSTQMLACLEVMMVTAADDKICRLLLH